MPFAMFAFRVQKASGYCSAVVIAVAVIMLCCHDVSSRSLLQGFVPQGLDFCTGYVQASCTLSTKAAPSSDSCSQQNAQQLAADVAAQDADQGVTLAFYGDSITKLWRDQNGHGMSQAYRSYFGNYSAAVLAVGGDQTANLWWRLENGQIYTMHRPQLSVVLIGTNDLGAASCGVGEPGVKAAVNGVVSRIQSITGLLLERNPDTAIVLIGLLPRGDSKDGNVYTQPNKYSQSIKDVNAGLQSYASAQSQVFFIDCANQLFPDGKIYDSIMPDGLHPTQGMDRLATCLSPLIYSHTKQTYE